MLRDRALKVVLVLLGLVFCAGIYPIADGLSHPDAAEALKSAQKPLVR